MSTGGAIRHRTGTTNANPERCGHKPLPLDSPDGTVGIGLILLASLMWSTAGIVCAALPEAVRALPATVGCARLLVAACCLLMVDACIGKPSPRGLLRSLVPTSSRLAC